RPADSRCGKRPTGRGSVDDGNCRGGARAGGGEPVVAIVAIKNERCIISFPPKSKLFSLFPSHLRSPWLAVPLDRTCRNPGSPGRVQGPRIPTPKSFQAR